MKYKNGLFATTLLKQVIIAGLIANSTVAFAGSTAHCYNFTDAGVGTPYNADVDVISVPHATVEFYKLRDRAGTFHTPVLDSTHIADTEIAGGIKPELRVYLSKVKFIPDQPITAASIKLAQNTGGSGTVTNIAVNGERVQIDGSIDKADKLVLGDRSTGEVLVEVSNWSHHDANWYRGDIFLTALSGTIESFAIGGNHMMIDDFCGEQ